MANATDVTDAADAAEQAGESSAGDLLRDIFARQASLGGYYRATRPDGFYSLPPLDRCTTWTRAIVHECCELDNELGWKPWKNEPDLAANRTARLMETADILHFLVQLALDQGFSADDLYAAYIQKNAENRRRQQSDPRYRPADRSTGAGPSEGET